MNRELKAFNSFRLLTLLDCIVYPRDRRTRVSAIFRKIHVRVRVRVRGFKNFHVRVRVRVRGFKNLHVRVRVRDFKISHVRVRDFPWPWLPPCPQF